MRARLGFVWGSFRFGKELISRMLLGGFKADFESVWVGLELICARCAARFSTNPKPAQNLRSHIPKAANSLLQKRAATHTAVGGTFRGFPPSRTPKTRPSPLRRFEGSAKASISSCQSCPKAAA